MAYVNMDVNSVVRYCEDVFKKKGFTEKESRDIVDVLITADLYGIESHGIQRLIRYYKVMLGTSPIAVCMPADPVDFWYDVATTVVTRGKLEVYNKKRSAASSGLGR